MICASASKAAVIVSMIWGTCGAFPLAAEERSSDVAFVEAVTGRVVAFVSGAPSLLGPLDEITDRTMVDLLSNSEVRICHYLSGRFLTIRGPARIMVLANGISVETGKAADISRETCIRPQATSSQGGVVARGVILKK